MHEFENASPKFSVVFAQHAINMKTWVRTDIFEHGLLHFPTGASNLTSSGFSAVLSQLKQCEGELR